MKNILVFSSLFILPVASFTYMLKDQFKNKFFPKQISKKDETRFNSNYYGLNWGSRTDEIVRP